MTVLDASAAVSAPLDDGAARSLLGTEASHAPHLIGLEVASVLRRTVASRPPTGVRRSTRGAASA